MYWKEAYKTRTKDSYNGYSTIYNNEPRLNFAELLDHMEQFTEVYRNCKDDHPAIREAKCLDAQFPQIMLVSCLMIFSAGGQTSFRWE